MANDDADIGANLEDYEEIEEEQTLVDKTLSHHEYQHHHGKAFMASNTSTVSSTKTDKMQLLQQGKKYNKECVFDNSKIHHYIARMDL